MQQPRVGVSILHEEQILEAIDQLRRRKARPDADRICNYLLRKFSVDARDTIADLHRLIEAEKVIQVDYKGNTSYRNASKWSRLQLYKNRPEGFVKEKLNSAMVAGAVAELVVEEPDYLDQGVPAIRLVEQLLDGVSNPTSRRMIEDFLNKEIASGNLTRLANGNYSLVATSDLSLSEPIREKTVLENGSARSSQEARISGTSASLTSLYEFDDGDDVTMPDSLSNTPRSSRQASPKSEQQMYRKEDCYEIIIGLNRKDSEEQEKRIASHSPTSDGKLEQKCDRQNPNLKKSGKAERKQRLFARMDDTADIEIKFEDYRSERKVDKREKEKREENGCFSEDRDEEDARSSTNTSPTPSSNNAWGFRSARRKRAKKVFDPSDNNLVKRKRGRQPGSQTKTISVPQDPLESLKPIAKDGPNRQCSLCSREKQESLIACRDCTVRAHPSCIYTSEELLQKSCTSWQCERCKSCVSCCETSDAGPLITCYNCDDAYHSFCHSPRVSSSKSSSKWQCNDCNQKSFKPILTQSIKLINIRSESPNNPLVLPPVLSPQVSPTRVSPDRMTQDDESCVEGMDPNIPDASDWTSEQVYQYFARLFPKEAEIFRHQDIDGPSLLMMKRSDVLNGLDLLLGPALKIYRHVLKLQVRRDDPKLYWL
ncbi:uncharacterized protein LOC117176048 [Belonocnema kinseyi]|uniref:uncharacterized protein LOC117176048 n=1 Tax=Belonocnema kinseyi TaxID=2817044 RepID=UPI00143CC93D|nr:uncharacterized protein LOC117176048 [Belonocnema kinseyi]